MNEKIKDAIKLYLTIGSLRWTRFDGQENIFKNRQTEYEKRNDQAAAQVR